MKSKLKKVGTLFLANAFSGEVAAKANDASQDPNIESNFIGFLKVFNSGTGKPIEQLIKDILPVLVFFQGAFEIFRATFAVQENTADPDINTTGLTKEEVMENMKKANEK